MGLDNFPDPLPCEVLEKQGLLTLVRKDSKIDCERTNCPFKKVRVVRGIFGTYCWIRGKYYENIIESIDSSFSFYRNNPRKELERLLMVLELKYDTSLENRVAGSLLNKEEENIYDLIDYLKTLLGIPDWNGVLVAWF